MHNGGRDRILTSASAFGLSKRERLQGWKAEDRVATK